MHNEINILFVGPDSLTQGGTTISFAHLLRSIKIKPFININVVNSSDIRGSGLFAPLKLIKLITKIFAAARNNDVLSFHAMPTALPYIGWLFPLVCKFYSKPLIFRSFGGMYYDELPYFSRTVARYFIRSANVTLLQTKELMEKGSFDNLKRLEWFPTARPMPIISQIHRETCRKFVFIGHLKKTKGLQFLARAAERLPADASVDVYGPWYDLPKKTFDGCKKIRYVRLLKADEVVDTLREYDALVFPSFMAEEGHSGIILEAYAAGIPVIATRWKALPEIVEDGKSGLLIEPQSDSAILQAMMRLYQDSDFYCNLVAGIQHFREQFSQERQTDHFLSICRELVGDKQQ